MHTTNNLALCVARPSSGLDPHKPVLVSCDSSIELPDNHVLIEVDRFGFSANNITYQALGEAPHFRYFDFHAAPIVAAVGPETHGLIPVWGFGTIVASTHPRLQVGERVYGYLAPTRYLVLPVSPADVNRFSFAVPRPHLPADRRPYNQITRCSSDPQYDPSPIAEDMTMLYRPLFWTAFWCEDWLHASGYRGTTTIIISSASAKTAFCLAYLIKQRRATDATVEVQTIGLTSGRNVAFTKGLDLYDDVLQYDNIESSSSLQSDSNRRWLYIDVAGSDELNTRVQKQLEANGTLVAGIQLGLTNLSPSAPAAATTKFTTNTDLVPSQSPGANGSFKMEQFFMPEWLAVRRHQMTVAQITDTQTCAWRNLMKDGKNWVNLERIHGGLAVLDAYKAIATKGTDPTCGMIWSLWDGPELGRKAQSRL